MVLDKVDTVCLSYRTVHFCLDKKRIHIALIWILTKVDLPFAYEKTLIKNFKINDIITAKSTPYVDRRIL